MMLQTELDPTNLSTNWIILLKKGKATTVKINKCTLLFGMFWYILMFDEFMLYPFLSWLFQENVYGEFKDTLFIHLSPMQF